MLLNLSDHSPEPLRSQIARQLRSKVLRGDLVTGNALPPVHVLARAHRVPALAAAQAYEALAREGVVEPDERGGYRVAGLSTGRLRELAQQRLLDDLHAQARRSRSSSSPATSSADCCRPRTSPARGTRSRPAASRRAS